MNAEELKEAIIKLLESNLEYYSTGWESFETLNRESKESVITGIEGLLDEYANQPKKYNNDTANKALKEHKINKYIPFFKDVIKTYLEIENQTTKLK